MYQRLQIKFSKRKNGVRWKNSTQRFEMHLFSGTARRRKLLLDKMWNPCPYVHFVISERGKTRPIDAPRIQDRQIHKVYTKKVLLPLYLPDMIWNNGASLPGKGFHFSKRLLREDLHYHFKRYGRDGSIILLDCKQFFPSASHRVIYARHDRLIHDYDLRKLGDMNGNGYMHSVVQPEMNLLGIIEMDDASGIAELMHSRK